MPYTGTKRKVFISHYKGDKDEVDAFIDEFSNQRIGVFRLQKLHKRLASLERLDSGAVGISELYWLHSQYFPVKRHRCLQ